MLRFCASHHRRPRRIRPAQPRLRLLPRRGPGFADGPASMLPVSGVSSLVCAPLGRARLLSLSVRRPFEVHFPTSDRRDPLRTRCASKDMLKMPIFRRRALVRSALLLAAPLLVLLGSTTSVAAQCEHFTPFGQPVHRSLGDDVGVSAPPKWTVICHTGQVRRLQSRAQRHRLGGPPPSARRPAQAGRTAKGRVSRRP